jgi:PPOX class probable F420-dependent enzyme
MPPLPLPDHLVEMLGLANPAVVGTVRPDGSPHTSATWYEWQDGRVLLNMDAGRARLGFMRHTPEVSLTVLDRRDWFRHVSLFGHIAEFRDDDGMQGIDRLAERYLGRPYPKRDQDRVNAYLQVERWYGWNAHEEVESLGDRGALSN